MNAANLLGILLGGGSENEDSPNPSQTFSPRALPLCHTQILCEKKNLFLECVSMHDSGESVLLRAPRDQGSNLQRYNGCRRQMYGNITFDSILILCLLSSSFVLFIVYYYYYCNASFLCLAYLTHYFYY
jgi:hypothetical protein